MFLERNIRYLCRGIDSVHSNSNNIRSNGKILIKDIKFGGCILIRELRFFSSFVSNFYEFVLIHDQQLNKYEQKT